MTAITRPDTLMAELARALDHVASGQQLSVPPSWQHRIDYRDSDHTYKIDGAKVPSVTQLLDETEPKPALNWWAYRVGLQSVLRLIQGATGYGVLTALDPEPVLRPQDYEGHPDVIWRGKGKARKLKHRLEAMALDAALSPNHLKTTKATLGTSIHLAAEELVLMGSHKPIEEFPELDRGYVQGLNRYFLDQEPDVQHSEVIVASKRFGYAGRFDTIVTTPDGQLRMRDYKTSTGVYPSFDRQLSLYDLAWTEMGGDPLDGHDVVHIRPDGTYAVVPCTVSHADALATLVAYHSAMNLNRRVKVLRG